MFSHVVCFHPGMLGCCTYHVECFSNRFHPLVSTRWFSFYKRLFTLTVQMFYNDTCQMFSSAGRGGAMFHVLVKLKGNVSACPDIFPDRKCSTERFPSAMFLQN
jgi:hypothetical protein